MELTPLERLPLIDREAEFIALLKVELTLPTLEERLPYMFLLPFSAEVATDPKLELTELAPEPITFILPETAESFILAISWDILVEYIDDWVDKPDPPDEVDI